MTTIVNAEELSTFPCDRRPIRPIIARGPAHWNPEFRLTTTSNDFLKEDTQGKMKIRVCAAIGKQHQLLRDGNIPWNYEESLEIFKNLIFKNSIIIPQEIYTEIPKEFLKDCEYVIVISNDEEYEAEGIEIAEDYDEAIAIAEEFDLNEVCIYGNQSLYEKALDSEKIDILSINHINYDGPANEYFPHFFENVINISIDKEIYSKANKCCFRNKEYVLGKSEDIERMEQPHQSSSGDSLCIQQLQDAAEEIRGEGISPSSVFINPIQWNDLHQELGSERSQYEIVEDVREIFSGTPMTERTIREIRGYLEEAFRAEDPESSIDINYTLDYNYQPINILGSTTVEHSLGSTNCILTISGTFRNREISMTMTLG